MMSDEEHTRQIEELYYRKKIDAMNMMMLTETVTAQGEELAKIKAYARSLEKVIENMLKE